jgi:hypothetical protein
VRLSAGDTSRPFFKSLNEKVDSAQVVLHQIYPAGGLCISYSSIPNAFIGFGNLRSKASKLKLILAILLKMDFHGT